MMKERIHWIDITKGLLIILMVFGHIDNIAGDMGIDDHYLVKCAFFSSLYGCFFMQAFLILTGYTSNFERDASSFFKSLIKTILIPWFSFSILNQVYRMCTGNLDMFLEINTQRYFFLFEDFWFLHVIFFGKLLYYVLYRLFNKDTLRVVVLLIMMISGFIIFSLNPNPDLTYHDHNYLHYKDILCMTFFIWVGNYCRRKNVFEHIKGKTLLVIATLYLLGHAIRLVFRINGLDELLIAPVVISHGGNAISPVQVPAYLYYVILGSFTLFGIMQKLNTCKLLDYFGRNSLVVYCIHFIFLELYIPLIIHIIIPNGLVNAIIYIVIVLTLTLASCVPVIKLLSYKPFSFLIGKF